MRELIDRASWLILALPGAVLFVWAFPRALPLMPETPTVGPEQAEARARSALVQFTGPLPDTAVADVRREHDSALERRLIADLGRSQLDRVRGLDQSFLGAWPGVAALSSDIFLRLGPHLLLLLVLVPLLIHRLGVRWGAVVAMVASALMISPPVQPVPLVQAMPWLLLVSALPLFLFFYSDLLASVLAAVLARSARSPTNSTPSPTSRATCSNRRCSASSTASIASSSKVELTFAGAGQVWWIVRAEGRVEELRPAVYPLGVRAACDVDVRSLFLEPGDAVFLASDGVVEAVDGDDESYGYERLVAALERCAGCPAQEMLEAVRRDLADHVGDQEADDDRTLLVLKLP